MNRWVKICENGKKTAIQPIHSKYFMFSLPWNHLLMYIWTSAVFNVWKTIMDCSLPWVSSTPDDMRDKYIFILFTLIFFKPSWLPIFLYYCFPPHCAQTCAPPDVIQVPPILKLLLLTPSVSILVPLDDLIHSVKDEQISFTSWKLHFILLWVKFLFFPSERFNVWKSGSPLKIRATFELKPSPLRADPTLTCAGWR